MASAEIVVRASLVRASWWRRLLAYFRGSPTAFCSRCGNPSDNGQRLPRGTGTVCAGIISLDGRERCIRLMVVSR